MSASRVGTHTKKYKVRLEHFVVSESKKLFQKKDCKIFKKGTIMNGFTLFTSGKFWPHNKL